MKLKTYFKQESKNKINQTDKFFLYEKIISQKEKKNSLFGRYFINVKSFTYALSVFILLVGIYGVYFFNGDFSYEGFMVQTSINEVNADYIAKVINFNGNFYIKHDGKYYKTSNISNGDSIILKKGSEMVFNINSGTKAKITGPAKFSINKNENNKYKILLSDGDYLQMESIKEQNQSIQVVTKNITISSNNHANFLLTKEDNEYQINNQGEKLTITQNEQTKQLENKQLLSIKDDKIQIIKNVEEFGEAIKNTNISQKFAIKNEEQSNKQQIVNELINDIDTKENKIENEELAKNLGLIDEKQIPTESQSKKLHSILNNNFVMGNIEDMFKGHMLGNQGEYSYNKSILESRIDKIYKLFDLKIQNSNIKEKIIIIQDKLQNNYHIPNKYIQNLNTIIQWIDYIENLDNGSQSNTTEDVNQLWNELETNTPNNLVLK